MNRPRMGVTRWTRGFFLEGMPGGGTGVIDRQPWRTQRDVPWWMKSMNSARVARFLRKTPRMALVMVLLLTFCTPRIIMHKWEASVTTATP